MLSVVRTPAFRHREAAVSRRSPVRGEFRSSSGICRSGPQIDSAEVATPIGPIGVAIVPNPSIGVSRPYPRRFSDLVGRLSSLVVEGVEDPADESSVCARAETDPIRNHAGETTCHVGAAHHI